EVVSSAVKWSLKARKKTVTLTNELETKVRKRAQQKIDELKGKMAKIKSGKSWKQAGFDSEGTYKLFMSRYERHLDMNQRIIDAPECKTGVYFDRAAVKHLSHNVRPDPRAWYKFRLIGGKNSPASHLSRFLDLIINGEKSGSMYVYGTVKDPQLSEITFRGNIFSSLSGVKIMNNNRTIGLSKDYPWEDNIWIDKLEIVGPYYDSKETPFEKILSGFLKNNAPSDEEVLQVLDKFSSLVFRNASNKLEYLNGLLNLYKKNLEDGLKSKDAIIDPLAVIISSPAFLYFHEKNKEDSSYIDEVSFANRLSYFLWSAPADDELMKLAKEGKLRDAAVVKQQIDRMLKSPKSEKFYSGFVEQWFDLKRFDSTTVDERKYPHYSFSVQESARKEPVAFIKEVIKSNLPISNFISSDFVVIDDVLASHYGIAKKHSPGFTKVNLAEGSKRGGLLTQTAFLVMGSTGERTSPVIRGTLVRDIFLNDPPPQPPPNVPELAFKDGEVKSIKQITKEHQSIPQCASCHRKIDPIGFGLENFNTVGLWREHEEPNTKAKGRKGRNAKGKKDIGAKVDPSGQLASGQNFNNFDEFKNVLLSKTDDLALSFYHGLLSYGIGRPISFVDEKEIKESLQSLKEKNYRLKDMILEVVTSRTFNSKK
ncbi:MAG: DUF1592 domain-containing protein, partial [Lentisphaeraceae bacterium]|nr:DUF1592 domain-containing protein [Lentisphaeraceae bacterium]